MNKLTLVMVAFLALGGCKNKGGNSGGAAMAKMTELRDEMCKCKDAKCAQDVSDKMSKWSQEQAMTDKQPPKMSDADAKKAAAITEEMGKCMQTAMNPSSSPRAQAADSPAGSDQPPAGLDTPPAGSAGGVAAPALDGMPPECAEYKAQVDKLRTCDKMPTKVQEALVKAYTDAAAGWKNVPADARDGLGTSCKAAAEAIAAAAKETCGW